MLLKLVICLLTFLAYVIPVLVWSSQLYSIVHVSQDFHESVSIVCNPGVCSSSLVHEFLWGQGNFHYHPHLTVLIHCYIVTCYSPPSATRWPPPIAIKLTYCILSICLRSASLTDRFYVKRLRQFWFLSSWPFNFLQNTSKPYETNINPKSTFLRTI